MACVAVNSLLTTIELEFLQPKPRPILQRYGLISSNKHFIQSLQQNLALLIELFDENRMDGIQAIKDLETKLRDVAFRVEDEIELQIVQLYEADEHEEEEEDDLGIADLFVEEPQGEIDAQKTWHSSKLGCILEEAIRDIDAIQNELSIVKMEYKRAIALQGWKTTLDDASTTCDEVIMMGDSSEHASHSEFIMVGKDNEFEIVKEMLIEHSSRQREIVSIKGMGGIGKTTLARRVYEDPSIASHFDKRGWVVASQQHNKLQMLTGLLESMGYKDSGVEEDRLAERLYQNLMHQRYFVVIDDIWSVEAWDSVKACFPDNGTGSRVLLTTRFGDVATIISSNNDFSHQMQLLDESESWNLFRDKATKSWDDEFESIERSIVEKCKGLPLAITVAAGLFSRVDTLDELKNITTTLNSSTTTTIEEECSKILSSSYNHLSHNLKACFLFLSIFPEDKEIYVKELVKLWAGEGLVKSYEDMSFDVAGQRHIQELKDRNLILVSQPSSCGRKVKAFRMHDLLHSFCVREAKKEKLLHVVYEGGSSSPPIDFRWVSIQSKRFDKQTLCSSLRNCRSIFYHSKRDIFLNLKIWSLLRVLFHIECKIAHLVHLRCLLSTESSVNISKPFCCLNLQILKISKADDEMKLLEFPQLQYFRIYKIPRNFSIFFHENLKTISLLQDYECTKKLFTNNPYLRKVKIRCKSGWKYCIINNLAYLHQLQSLYLYGRSVVKLPNNNHIFCLRNLTKLSFDHMRFEGKEINNLSKLSELKVLKLIRCWWMGEEWELAENENFDQLIYLKMRVSGLKHWNASACHFPNLEHLVLDLCNNLEKIPAEFAEIPNLKSINLDCCLHSAVVSAKEIQKEQHEQGNYDMVVIQKRTIQ